MSTTRLDDLVGEIGPIDFVKLDVQGGELDVIRGGTNALQQACVLQVGPCHQFCFVLRVMLIGFKATCFFVFEACALLIATAFRHSVCFNIPHDLVSRNHMPFKNGQCTGTLYAYLVLKLCFAVYLVDSSDYTSSPNRHLPRSSDATVCFAVT